MVLESCVLGFRCSGSSVLSSAGMTAFLVQLACRVQCSRCRV